MSRSTFRLGNAIGGDPARLRTTQTNWLVTDVGSRLRCWPPTWHMPVRVRPSSSPPAAASAALIGRNRSHSGRRGVNPCGRLKKQHRQRAAENVE